MFLFELRCIFTYCVYVDYVCMCFCDHNYTSPAMLSSSSSSSFRLLFVVYGTQLYLRAKSQLFITCYASDAVDSLEIFVPRAVRKPRMRVALAQYCSVCTMMTDRLKARNNVALGVAMLR